MLYLLLAIVCGATYSVFFKLFACRGVDSLQAIAFNYLTAFALGTAFACVSGDFVVPTGVASWGTAVLLGSTFVGAFVLMARSTALTGVTLTTVASRVSLVIPVVCSFLLFPEGDAPRWWAVAVILVAMVMMFVPSGEKRTQQRLQRASLLLYPLGVWVLFGVNNFGLKWAQSVLIAPQESAAFSAIIFLFAVMFAVVALMVRRDKRGFEWGALVGGVTLGVANFFVTWGLLRGLAEVPASIFFPTYHTTIVALVAVVGTVAFKERLSKVQWLGVAVAVLGIVMFFV